jgi:hypothetical protein
VLRSTVETDGGVYRVEWVERVWFRSTSMVAKDLLSNYSSQTLVQTRRGPFEHTVRLFTPRLCGIKLPSSASNQLPPLTITMTEEIPQSSASSITVAEPHFTEKHTSSDSDQHTLKPRPWNRKTTPYSRIIHQAYDGAGTKAQPFLIDWAQPLNEKDEFVDRENPMTYGRGYKWTVVMLAAMSTLGVSMASSMLSAAVFDMHVDFPGKPTETYIMGE